MDSDEGFFSYRLHMSLKVSDVFTTALELLAFATGMSGSAIILCGIKETTVALVTRPGRPVSFKTYPTDGLKADLDLLLGGETLAINDVSSVQLPPGLLDLSRLVDMQSLIAAPLFDGETVFGFALAYSSGEHTPISSISLDRINILARDVSLAIRNATLYESQSKLLSTYQSKFEEEHAIADNLRKTLLSVPKDINGIDYGYFYRSVSGEDEVGGDFYDLFELDDARIGIAVGDVSGKGFAASTFTSVVKSTLRAYAMEYDSPAIVLCKANEALGMTPSSPAFVTIFFAVLDRSTGRLTYCSAGHPPAIRKSPEFSEYLKTTSPIIGAFPGLDYVDSELYLKNDDILILYTDGLIETRCQDGLYGEERLLQTVKSFDNCSTDAIPRLLFENVSRSIIEDLSDDIVILAVSRRH